MDKENDSVKEIIEEIKSLDFIDYVRENNEYIDFYTKNSGKFDYLCIMSKKRLSFSTTLYPFTLLSAEQKIQFYRLILKLLEALLPSYKKKKISHETS